MNEIIGSIKLFAEPEMAASLLKNELENIRENFPDYSEEELLRENFSAINKHIIESYEEMFIKLYNKITNHLEKQTSSYDEQLEKAIRAYLEVQALQKHDYGFAYQIPEKENLTFSIESLTLYFDGIAKYFRYNQLLLATSSYLERNYIEFITDKTIFPWQVQDLLSALANDDFEIIKDNNSISGPMYKIEYNSYDNLSDYKNYLNGIYEKFTDYMNIVHEIILEQDKLALFYSVLQEYLHHISTSFDSIDADNILSNNRGTMQIRKNTETLLQDYISGLFEDSIGHLSSKKLYRMMDTQYHMTTSALNIVQKLINILKKRNEINEASNPGITTNKIRLEISTNRFYFLIRMLREENVIKEKVLAGLFRKVKNSFRTDKKKELSTEAMHNSYYSSDKKCADYWVEKFTHMKQRAIDVRDRGTW